MAKNKKRKNTLTLIAMLGLLVVMIGAYGLLLQHNKDVENTSDEEEEAQIPLNEIEESEIKELQVLNETTEFTLINKDEMWSLKEEEAFPVDQNTASNLASRMASLQATKEVIENANDLAEYGLDSPEITVTIKKSDDSTMTLSIGDQLTTGNDYYATINNETTVYVVEALVRNTFITEKNDLMQIEDLPSIKTELITGVKVTSNQFSNFTLMYDENNKDDYSGSSLYPWYITGHYKENANADLTAVNQLLTNYTSLSFKEGVDYKKENLDQYGLKTPENALTIWYREEEGGEVKDLTLYLGNQNDQGEYYVRLEGFDSTYTIASSTVSALFDVDVYSITAKSTNLISIDSITNFTVNTGSISHMYTVEQEVSTDSEGKETTTDIFAVDGVVYEDDTNFRSFYQNLIGLTIEGILPEDATIKEDPVLRISWQLKEEKANGEKTYTVEYLPYDNDSYAVRTNDKLLFTISKEKVAAAIMAIKEFE